MSKKLLTIEKLKIAIEALKFHKRYCRDSRNWGIIDTKVDEALRKLV